MIAHTRRKVRKQEGERDVVVEVELGDTIIRNVGVTRGVASELEEIAERDEEEVQEESNTGKGSSLTNSSVQKTPYMYVRD